MRQVHVFDYFMVPNNSKAVSLWQSELNSRIIDFPTFQVSIPKSPWFLPSFTPVKYTEVIAPARLLINDDIAQLYNTL